MRSGDLVGGRFRVESLAGSGGMGSVWRAHDQETGRKAALKLLHGRDPRDTARFIREAQVIAALAHPGIVRYVADGLISESERYLVMEWLEGESLADRLEREPLSLAEVLEMGRRAAEALGAMHRHGVVHRDLKPSNLFLEGNEPERVKIIDFGIARRAGGPEVTRTGVLLGTPGFIAPEQALGDPGVDARADVFALGCVLFKCITGEGAFGAEDDLTILLRIVKGTARRAREVVPRLPAEIDDTLAAMLARDPADRPRDASVVAAALARLSAIYGAGRPGDDPLDDLVTTRNQSILEDDVSDEALLGTTRPFPLTVPRARSAGESDDAPLLSPDDLEEIHTTQSGRGEGSSLFSGDVARALAAAEKAGAPPVAPRVPPRPALRLGSAPPAGPPLAATPAQGTAQPAQPAPAPPARVGTPAQGTALPAQLVPAPPARAGTPAHGTALPASLVPAPLVRAGTPAHGTPLPLQIPLPAPSRTTPSQGVKATAATTPLPASAPFGAAPEPAPSLADGNDPALVRCLQQAEEALRRNDFRTALLHARRGIEGGARGALHGALRVRQAEAYRWRGERAAAERAASEALASLPPGDELWWIAAREAVVGAGARSDAARVGALAGEIMQLWSGDRAGSTALGTLTCTAAFLMHTGQKELLGRFLRWTAPMLEHADQEPPAIAARLHQLRALRATHEGDLGSFLQAAEAASERFAAAQDMRDSLVQRVNVAYAKIELGAYSHGEADLRATIVNAERMGLNNVALAARANLGIVLAKRGSHADARAVMIEVLKESVAAGDRRFEASARTQLSLILLGSGDVEGAVREAKGAVELTPPSAPSRVFALGALARSQLAHGRPEAALEAAEQAMELLEAMGGVEEGESLVRLVFARAKRETGDVEGAAAAISAARARLRARAMLIQDTAFRQSFLRDVADNAQTLHLCREWLNESREWST